MFFEVNINSFSPFKVAEKCFLGDTSICTKSYEVYAVCGTACPKTCQKINEEPTVCTRQCVKGCFRKTGYIRDKCSGKCIKPEGCPMQQCKTEMNW